MYVEMCKVCKGNPAYIVSTLLGRCIFGTPGRLQFWIMTALEDNRFPVASRLIPLKSLAVHLRLFYLNTFLATLLAICNNNQRWMVL